MMIGNERDPSVSRISRGMMRKVFVRPIRNRSLTLNGIEWGGTIYKRHKPIDRIILIVSSPLTIKLLK
jgi:hypothetical protein